MPHFDFPATRTRWKSYFSRKGKGPKPPTAQELYETGLKIEADIQEEYPDRLKAFHETGVFSRKMPKDVQKVMDTYASQLKSHYQNQYLHHNVDYISLSMLKYVYDQKKREEILAAVLELAIGKNPSLKEKKDSPFPPKILAIKKKLLEDIICLKPRLFRDAIRIGLELGIVAPLENFTSAMNAAQHLKYIATCDKQKIILADRAEQLEQIKVKILLARSPVSRIKLNENMAQLQTDPAQKEIFLENALIEIASLQTDAAKKKYLPKLALLAKENNDDLLLEEISLAQEAPIIAANKKESAPVLAVPVMMPPEVFFHQEMNAALAYKTPKAKAKHLSPLLELATSRDAATEIAVKFAENATMPVTIDRVLELSKRKDEKNIYSVLSVLLGAIDKKKIVNGETRKIYVDRIDELNSARPFGPKL